MILASLMVAVALPVPRLARAQAPAPTVPAAPLSPNEPEAQLDPSRLALRAISAPSWGASARSLPAGAATEEVTHIVGSGQTAVSAAPAELLHGSTESSRRYESRSSRPSRAASGFSIQKVIGRDERVRVGTSYPYSAQCKLFITFPDGEAFIGSGTLIGPKHLLTAGHCAWSAENGGWAKSIEVVPGLSGAYKPFGSAWAHGIRAYRGYTEGGDRNHDFALITLDRPIGNSAGWFGYAYWPEIEGYTANIAGYPGDRDNGVYQYYHSGPIDKADEMQVYYRIDTYGGQSGSGVYSIEEDGGRYVFAVHAWGNDQTNGGTRIDSTKFDSITAWMAVD
jgi:V8-like Glu-specific endopeptidase